MSEVPPNVQLVFELYNKLDMKLKKDVRSMLFLYNIVKRRDIHQDINVSRGASTKAKEDAICEYTKIALSLYSKKYDYIKAFEAIFISQDDTDVVMTFLDEFRVKLEPTYIEMFIKTGGKKRVRELTYERLNSLRNRVLKQVEVEKVQVKEDTSRFGRTRKPSKNPDFFTGKEIDKAFAVDSDDDSIADDSTSEWYMIEHEDKTLFYDFELGGFQYRGRCEFMADGYAVTGLEYGENNQIKEIEPIPIKTLELHKKDLSEHQKSFDGLKDDAVNTRQTLEKVFTRNEYFNFRATMPWGEGNQYLRENKAVIFGDESIVTEDEYTDDGSEDYTTGDESYVSEDKFVLSEGDNEEEYEEEYDESAEAAAKRPKLNLQDPTQVYKALRKLHIYGKLKY
jgi:hypothetical protein